MHHLLWYEENCQAICSHLLSNHPANCPCDCGTCSEKKCRPEAMDTNWLQTHFLCTKAQLLHGSEHNYHCWECLPLKCEKCFLNKPSVLLCERSAFDDPSVTMKWEQWDTMDYSRRNLVGTGPFPLNPQQQQGVPLRFISPFLLFGQIIVQNSLNPDINWVGLYLMSTRQLWM